MEDQIAIQRLKEKDVSGLEYLVSKYQQKATQAAWLIMRDRQTAEDIASQAFLRVYRSINRFKPDAPFGPWLYRIVVNLCLDQIKHERRLSPLEPDGAEELSSSKLSEPSVENLLEQAQNIEEMMLAFEDLRPEHRAVIVARYFLGLSEKEATDELQTSVSTVKWRTYTAIHQLRQALIPGYQVKNRKEE
ncbi:MAG: RNA polymerase sigma factor [Anaerolineaceae bacterium]|nr:RNA polymerase sigma factor [Anaerolineaceae bacterium]